MIRSKHNRQYANKPTKRNDKATKQALALIIALTMIMSTYSAITSLLTSQALKQAPQQQPQTTNISIKDLTIISVNTDNQQTAYLAVSQACDKHLPTSKYGKSINTNCIKDLISIAHQENTDFSLDTIGRDKYQSLGLFQISKHYHPEITTEQQNDPYFSADWTLKRLISNHYLTNRAYAIRKHNGDPTIKQTAHYLKDIDNYKANLSY